MSLVTWGATTRISIGAERTCHLIPVLLQQECALQGFHLVELLLVQLLLGLRLELVIANQEINCKTNYYIVKF